MVNFNRSASECDTHNQSAHGAGHGGGKGGDHNLIDQVQTYVTNLNIGISLIENIPSVFFVLFLGRFLSNGLV